MPDRGPKRLRNSALLSLEWDTVMGIFFKKFLGMEWVARAENHYVEKKFPRANSSEIVVIPARV